MSAAQKNLARALEYAPTLALIHEAKVLPSVRIAAACVAGGYSTLAVSARLPDPGAVIASAGAKPGVLVGVAGPITAPDVHLLALRGCAFVLAPSMDPAVGEACLEAKIPWIPGVSTADELLRARAAGAKTVHLWPITSLGGPRFLRLLADAIGPLNAIVSGGIPGNSLATYLNAGATAVAVSGALYSNDVITTHDWPSVREHAALVHRDACYWAAEHSTR